jgi:hypothetical protein
MFTQQACYNTFSSVFFILFAMCSAVNLGNIVLQRHCWFTGSCFLLASPLIFYFPVVFVVVCMFVLLQFAGLGFCNRDWKSDILGGLVVAFFFVCWMLFIVF